LGLDKGCPAYIGSAGAAKVICWHADRASSASIIEPKTESYSVVLFAGTFVTKVF
jgi:hypothetical protein